MPANLRHPVRRSIVVVVITCAGVFTADVGLYVWHRVDEARVLATPGAADRKGKSRGIVDHSELHANLFVLVNLPGIVTHGVFRLAEKSLETPAEGRAVDDLRPAPTPWFFYVSVSGPAWGILVMELCWLVHWFNRRPSHAFHRHSVGGDGDARGGLRD